MVQAYNLSNLTTGNDISAIAIGMNQLTDGMFGIGLLIATLAITYWGLRSSSNRPDQEVVGLVLWFGVMASLMLQIIGLVDWGITMSLLAVSVLSIIYIYFKQD